MAMVRMVMVVLREVRVKLTDLDIMHEKATRVLTAGIL